MMVQCHLRLQCKKHEWYHVVCIGKEATEHPEIWYCSEDCEMGAGKDDYVRNHSKALMWSGLNLLALRDAVCEGNGDQIISHWKRDMLKFWTSNQFNYFKIGHRYLSGVAGFLPDRLAFNLKWNRLVNISGTEGGNIGMDLANQLLSSDFKEMMKHYIRHLALNQVNRCTQIGGAFDGKVDKVFCPSGLGSFETHKKYTDPPCFEDIALFMKEFQGDALFDYCPVRCHHGFEDFQVDEMNQISSPRDMGKKLLSLSEQLDSLKAKQTETPQAPELNLPSEQHSLVSPSTMLIPGNVDTSSLIIPLYNECIEEEMISDQECPEPTSS